MHQRPKRGYHGRRMATHMAWGISTNGDIGMKHVSELANFAEVEPNPNWSIYSPICKLVNLCLVRFSSSGIECWFDTDDDNVIKWFSTYVAQILQSLLMWLWPTKTHGTNWESKKLMCEAAWGKTQPRCVSYFKGPSGAWFAWPLVWKHWNDAWKTSVRPKWVSTWLV